ncbi:helix-turn-helix domain-containing protein [Novosphingobium sp. NDB2Meth1]|uniref:helix-turn-helix domain-containing protein n=1 Tax=Novosphingobium sp. NDB2Meth1 TaxID=1892847 RepID=UPI0009301444|nr:helix-turn-helix domain-containing protein [Novosphingobium sp. NDB2Meth1]
MSALATPAQLAALIGEDTAGELARAFAGQSLCLPADPAEEPRLEAAIGPIAAACLCEELGGHTIAFPAAPIAAPASPVPSPPASPARAASVSKMGSRVLDEIAEVIGEEATWRLAEEFGGERLYVPRSPSTDPRIAKAIGQELTEKLCDTFYRLTISIPIRLITARRVAEMVRQGDKSNREIARALHITERQVYRILEGLRAA